MPAKAEPKINVFGSAIFNLFILYIMPNKSEWPKYLFHVKPFTYEKITQLAKHRGIPLSRLINEILETYISTPSINLKLSLFDENEKKGLE